MKKLQSLSQPGEPDLAIVREFDDAAAANILSYQENGGLVCWKAVGKNTQTTAGYGLADATAETVIDSSLATPVE